MYWRDSNSKFGRAKSPMCWTKDVVIELIYSGFKVIEAGIFFTETSDYFSEILWSSFNPCLQICHLCVTYVEWFVQLWHMTGFQLFCANRDGCHMWGRKCSLFPEHLWGCHDFTHSLYADYILLNLSVLGLFMVVIQTLFTNVTPLCHICWMVCSLTVTYDWFPVICVNRDGCHMWGRKCSLFPEHLISLRLGRSWFHPFIIYTLYITEFVSLRLCLRINDWFVCLDLSDCFVSDLFDIYEGFHGTHRSVDELATLYIFRRVCDVFHILLK